VIGDVCKLDDLNAAVSAAMERYGRLDAAIGAAGVIGGGAVAWETADELWQALLDVNLKGVWNLARAAIPTLLTQPEPRRGRFVAVSSAAGLRGFPQLAAYSASKHGVIGLVRSIALELGGRGITANVVCPGSMDTEMLMASAALYGLSTPEEFARHHITERLLESTEVANAIAWLCSVESSGITGAVLPVDAGMTAK
jgi:SDR family mycofactocin-dependent oxidoreductase